MGVTMSLHNLTAGSGYDYLTRQVAAMDSTEKGHTGLASYYTEKGETPGLWVGSGMADIDGLAAGDIVTAEQMQSLFGSGHHPLAAQRKLALGDQGQSEKDYIAATRLGQPFKVYDNDVSEFRIEVARRLELLNKERGLPRKAANAIEDRARIRSQVALEMFRTEHGRDPLDARERSGHLAKLSRQQTTAVAGYDLTFSPVKSVSTLWALADPQTAAAIERAHHKAVADALSFIERRALFTRVGANGARQVEVRGLVAAAFTHRDSRAGDPDLHTHVAVANKVQTRDDGRWLAIDGRLIYNATVAASETYNTALERHLSDSLGLRFAVRAGGDPRKRPVREVVDVEPALNERWSARRRSIEVRRRELAAQFQRNHGRPPSPVEAHSLAQQATLETREAKHEPRSLAEQRAAWRDEARQVLGGDDGIQAMLRRALSPRGRRGPTLDEAWLSDTARAVVSRVQEDRSTWQTWHLRAEALRVARFDEVPAARLDQLVDEIVYRAVARSQPLTRHADGEPAEPAPLRRSDGTSVYTVAESQRYTSSEIINAEARLVAAAGQRDGMVVPAIAVDLALLQSEANGVTLNAGQVLLVREMSASGARLQLAIAPAGAGKTTAMNALASAWTEAGGNVIGLAPSAAAAAALGDQIDGHVDTMAKLVFSLHKGEELPWMAQIGPQTLVIIDEAGMADTLALDAVVGHVLARGGNVRLIGDDQQLAAIGAGGVLRDIQASHGALRLTELVRFTDRAEGSASLALREGHTSSLGFYLDHGRIHVGDQTTMADDLFAAWSADRAGGVDSIMLAPTRELVSELNQRARDERLAGNVPASVIELADGNLASAGDTIITRMNERKLPVSATDFVKNGDRWTVISVDRRRGIRARHTQHGRLVTLPTAYVSKSVELGYASTTHTAQGVTADTMHGLLAGGESRQQAYTMLTRGREANHAYVVVVGDGDPHTVIRPETINPLSPTDILERILARDESPVSATTQLRDSGNPRRLLGDATVRYSDALGFAAAHIAGDIGVRGLERAVDHALPGLTRGASWPALRAQLLQVHADGQDPIAALERACARPLGTAHDPCSVLAWRIADAERRDGGPLPWLPGVPAELAQHPMWGPYLTARRDLVRDLSEQVRSSVLADEEQPLWLTGTTSRPTGDLVADVEVWRAATQVAPADTRPTGERRHGLADARWQAHLDTRLAAGQSAALAEWKPLLRQVSAAVLADEFAPILAARLSQLASSGINARGLLHAAAAQGPLPDDHAAAALWWRMARRLSPAVAQVVDTDHHISTAWLPDFTTRVGPATAHQLQGSGWWPALVTTIERGLQRGWQLDQLLDDTSQLSAEGHLDLCQAWVWRLSLLTDRSDILDEDRFEPDERPEDLYDGWEPSGPVVEQATPGPTGAAEAEPDFETDDYDPSDEQILGLEALVRATMGAPEPGDAELRLLAERHDALISSPVAPQRLAQVNEVTAAYYQACLAGSWAQPYLAERLRADVDTLTSRVHAGYAPEGWTSLVGHLRRHGISDLEMVTAGVAVPSSTGRLIDRFRDRAVFPIVHDGNVLGFVARRNPAFGEDDNRGPKYLNTSSTPIFNKGDQLFVAGELQPGVTPVVVEGPLDAWAVTLSGDGDRVGAAPLGTSLTDLQVAQLHSHGSSVVVATDADVAGRVAAERDFWLLAMYGLDPRYATFPNGADPAALVAAGDAVSLNDAIAKARPLAETLIDERIANLADTEAILEAVQVVAAQPPSRWADGIEHIAARTGIPSWLVQTALAPRVLAWNADVRKAALNSARQTAAVKARLIAVASQEAARQRPETAGPDPSRLNQPATPSTSPPSPTINR